MSLSNPPFGGALVFVCVTSSTDAPFDVSALIFSRFTGLLDAGLTFKEGWPSSSVKSASADSGGPWSRTRLSSSISGFCC